MYNESNYIRQLPMLNAGESIIWHGKPKRGVFILTKSLNCSSSNDLIIPIKSVVMCSFDKLFIILKVKEKSHLWLFIFYFPLFCSL